MTSCDKWDHIIDKNMTLKIIFAPSKFDSSDKMANNDQMISLKRISQDEILHLSLPVIQRDF